MYWPAFLLAAGLRPPKHVFAHGFLTYNGEKMSKSLRNTVSPVALAQALSPDVGVDVLRYCLMRAISFGQDGDFSIKDVLQRYQSELGNKLGNLVNRILPFDEASRQGRAQRGPLELKLVAAYEAGAAAAATAFDELSPTRALDAIWALLAAANDYVDKAAPWAAKKKGDVGQPRHLRRHDSWSCSRAVSVMVAPVMPTVSAMIRERLALPPLLPEVGADRWPSTLPTLTRGAPFVRLGAHLPALREGAGGRDHRRAHPEAGRRLPRLPLRSRRRTSRRRRPRRKPRAPSPTTTSPSWTCASAWSSRPSG